MNERDLLIESFGFGVASENNEMKVKIFKESENSSVMTIENFVEEDEEEKKVRVEKALEEFKKEFKGELTDEILVKITKQVEEKVREEHLRVAKEIEEERIKVEEEREKLRQEEFEAELMRVEELQREADLNKGKLEIIETQPQAQPIQTPTTQIYLGKQEGQDGEAKKKMSFGKRIGLKFKRVFDFIFDTILNILVVVLTIFLAYIIFCLIFPNVEVPETLKPIVDWLRPYFDMFLVFIKEMIKSK